jgi:NAD(P)-dependent dehydrogenase (short-subunit alcohol dehydrogenase family)
MVDVDQSALESATQSLGDGAIAVRADVSQKSDVREAIGRTVEQFDGLDILVNNAGICPLRDFADVTEEEWDRVLGVNLKGAFFCCQAALPHLQKSGERGRVINISSVAGQSGGVLAPIHYSASKAGLIVLTKTLARILAPDRATVNCVAPGTTATDLTDAWAEELRERVKAAIPLGRLGQPEEIAEMVCFLASDKAAFVTGATFDVNGGLFIR